MVEGGIYEIKRGLRTHSYQVKVARKKALFAEPTRKVAECAAYITPELGTGAQSQEVSAQQSLIIRAET